MFSVGQLDRLNAQRWTWETASSQERGDWIRHHHFSQRIPVPGLAHLFQMDEKTITRILNGANPL